MRHQVGIFSGLAVMLYSSVQVVVMLFRTAVPDESWFSTVASGVADVMAVSGLITVIAEQTNLLGYGAIYWLVFGLAHYTPDAFLTMRGLAWLAVTIVPLAIVMRGLAVQSRYTIFALSLWFIMPVAWWDGKLIGPDLYVQALTAVGLTGIFNQRWWVRLAGWAILGSALGIRLNVLPVLVYGAMVTGQRLRSAVVMATATIGGFILANLFILRGLMPWYDLLKQYTTPGYYTWAAFKYILTNQQVTWDHIHVGGLFQVSLNSASLIALLVWCVLANVPKQKLFSAVLAVVVALALFLSSGIFYGWYWFPTLLLFPFILLEAQHYTRRLAVMAGVIIVLGAITALPIIYSGYRNQPITGFVNFTKALRR